MGALSPCGQFGYAMESKCHAGKSIVYDTTGLLGWSSSLLSHRVVTLTDDLLTMDWSERVKKEKGKGKGKSKGQGEQGVVQSKWRWPWRGAGDEEGEPEDETDKLGSVPPRLSEDQCRGGSDSGQACGWTSTDSSCDFSNRLLRLDLFG